VSVEVTTDPILPSPEEHPRRLRTVLGVTLVGLVLVAIGTVAAYERHSSVDPSLTSARAELHQELDRLSAAQSELGSTSGQADAVAQSLASDTTLLTRDQAQLADTEGRTDLQGVNISDLHLCLAGVERALNQFALGDRSGATGTLGTVTTLCRDAEPVGT